MQGFILVENVLNQKKKKKTFKQAFKIKQSKWKNQADCANYSSDCVYIVSQINSKRKNYIHMLRWKVDPQSDNNKNALTKITCTNSFLALCVKSLSLEESLANMSQDNFTIR